MFQDELEISFGEDLEEIFNPYVYGNYYNGSPINIKHEEHENPYHPKLSDEELRSLL